ncbi:nuclear transport factor 2 family protein [Caulobacter sp. 17J80-11]|uniref:nuclear transport factor 2 family protein n=1 Tax=Caulobacter sp. 17J80-11 TaxID=2763502 RepID=UPI001653CFF9|nr:nuclear transport factor 2 family protein [Caulobacter sp. 17J80-11]MBC6980788.1 nuclear transport factor 2 family protein [Caulobacter sp. 17J80-11]
MDQADVALVKKAYEAYGRGDTEAIIASVAPDAHWEFVGRREEHKPFGPRRGPEGAREFFKALTETEDYSEFTPKEFHLSTSGDKLFVLGHAEGKVKPSGQPFAGDWIHVFEVKDGKISSWRGFMDTSQFVRH